MKIRTITLGVFLEAIDFSNECIRLKKKFQIISRILNFIEGKLIEEGYEVQTKRVAFNQMEDWLPTSDCESTKRTSLALEYIGFIVQELDNISIDFCNLGGCQTASIIQLLPQILSLSNKIHSSVRFHQSSNFEIAPEYAKCLQAAKTSLEILKICGPLGNFRFCSSFNCSPGIPFFPAAFHASKSISTTTSHYSVSIGLENGDLLFLAFHGANSIQEGRDNLFDVLKQVLSPIQEVVEKACEDCNRTPSISSLLSELSSSSEPSSSSSSSSQITIDYAGIDASLNPGLSLPESIGYGIEQLLSIGTGHLMRTQTHFEQGPESSDFQLEPPVAPVFGDMGTLSVVSAITSAVKQLALPLPLPPLTSSSSSSSPSDEILLSSSPSSSSSSSSSASPLSSVVVGAGLKLVGYNGLMLPVMEDLILAQRTSRSNPLSSSSTTTTTTTTIPSSSSSSYSLRDLLYFSSVCGVGLDTVPIRGDVTVEEIANCYLETGSLAYRLNKPLSCRLLPMPGKSVGEMTEVENNPYLCNARVFGI